MQPQIPMASPDISEEDVQAVAEVVRSGVLALGPKAQQFEEAIARYTGARHAVAVSSGTAALHVALRALGIGPGDEVLVPSFTFAASVNAILYEGARPVFVDVDPETFNVDPDDLERKTGPAVRAVMAVDAFGHPAPWDEIRDFARDRGLALVDDSCEALGAEYKGRRLGTLADASTFAFYPNKQITTGEGGMVVTDDDEVARACRSLRNQGRDEMGAWLSHPRMGYNYRMDEMSAALGLSQMARIESFLEARERVARAYGRRLARLRWVRPPVVLPHARMSWFVYVVTLEEGVDRDRVIEHLAREGVPARGYFSPMHQQPYLRGLAGSLRRGGVPVTERVARRTLALPFHNRLTEGQIDRVVAALETMPRQAILA